MTKKKAKKLNYDGIKFPVQEKNFSKIEIKIIYALMCLVMTIN